MLNDDHLQEIDLVPVIGVKSVGFVVVEDMNCSAGNPVLLQHKLLIGTDLFIQV